MGIGPPHPFLSERLAIIHLSMYIFIEIFLYMHYAFKQTSFLVKQFLNCAFDRYRADVTFGTQLTTDTKLSYIDIGHM